jgi:autotransporter-associated beta strand protein
MKRPAIIVVLLVVAACCHAAVPAFPGAEGFGAFATGGRYGDVYHVVNLSSSAATPGSFAYGLANAPTNGRTIVFDVSGYIPVSGNLYLDRSKITIAGQTAPGDGVGLKGGTFWIRAGDSVIRHFRFRNGVSADCVDITSAATNTMIDHCDLLFSKDENFSSFGTPPENLTFQWSANAWGLYSHSAGGLWDMNHVTAHHTLWAHNHTRDPKAHPNGLLDWINNVTYDYGIGFIMGDSTSTADWKANVEGCYFVCPPANIRGYVLSRASLAANGDPNFSLFYTNCLFDRDGDTILDGRAVVSGDITGSYRLMTNPIPRTAGVPVTQDSPLVAYKKIVSSAGPLRLDALHAGGLRDEVSTELIRSMTTWRRDVFSSVADTGASGGGYGTLNSAPTPADADRDGMPDFWETALGSNPTVDDHTNAVPAGAFIPNVPAGYTLLEEYLHFKATPHVVVPRSFADSLTSLDVDLRRYTSGFTNKPPITYTLSSAANGTVTLVGGNVAHFEPATNFFGRARFDFSVTDGDGSSWTQTFLVLVSAVALPRDLRWKGDGVTNAWSTNAANFLVVTNAAVFRDGDNVTFDDAGSAVPFVRLNGTMSPASVTVAASNNFTLGGSGALAGAMTLAKSGAGTLTLTNANTYSGGTVISEGEVVIAPGGNIGSGSNTLAGGTLTSLYGATTDFVLGGDVVVPAGQTGTVNFSKRMALTGASGGGTLNLNISGTTFNYDRLNNNYAGFAGTLNITGTVANALLTLNYNGGGFDGNWSNAAVSLDNVTLQGRHNSGGNTLIIGALSGTATARLGGSGYAGNETLDLGRLNLDTTFAGRIEDGVATTFLNKNGTGLFTLSGTNSYTGATAVNAGELRVTGSLSGSAVTVVGNATLSGTGTLGGGVTVQSGAILSPGLDLGNAGTLTVSNGLTLPAPTLLFDLSSSPVGANDRITMLGGTLAMSGVQNYLFNLTDGFLGAGTYSLIEGATNSTAWSGVTHNLPAGSRQTFALQRPAAGSIPSYVRLIVTGDAASLVWRGTNGNAWDSATTNWLNGAAADRFFPFDAVRFDDSATNGNVTISGAVAPRSVIVSNTTRSYTLGGGSLDGATSLLKQGAGTLTLSGSNGFSGGIFLNGGTLALANDTANAFAPGSGPITFGGGTLAMFDEANSYNSFLADLVVPTGATGTFNADGRCDIYSSLSGGGTLNFRAQFVRTTVFGNWSAFTGRLNILRGPNGGDFRIGAGYSWPGLPRAAVNLGTNTTFYYAGTLSDGAGTVVELGELSGASSARLMGGATGWRSLTYRIGGLNTDAAFAGTIAEQNTDTTTHFEKLGSGTWTLGGNNSHLGDTLVSAGTLLLNSPVGSGTGLGGVTVASGARLAGSGAIAGEVTLAPGATLDPIGTLTLSNALTLDDASTLAFALGINSDRVNVAGDLVLGGTFQFTDAGGFGPGSYTLITWDGEFAAGNFAIGSVPSTNFTYALDTNTPGQLRLVVSGGPTNIIAPVTIIAAGSVWKYFDQTNDLGTAWRSNNFNDAAWPSGPAMLGFGDANGLFPATIIASNRQWTTYFRRAFHVPDANLVQSLDARILRDDGAVVYLNGTEIWRDTNMPAGLITNTTPARSALGGTNETNWLFLNFQPSTLNPFVTGTNVLAIEVHQNAVSSSDLAMNFELTGTALMNTNTSLTLIRNAGALMLSWPTDAAFLALYSTTNLSSPHWLRATNEPVPSNGQWTTPLPMTTNGQRFFRLQAP